MERCCSCMLALRLKVITIYLILNDEVNYQYDASCFFFKYGRDTVFRDILKIKLTRLRTYLVIYKIQKRLNRRYHHSMYFGPHRRQILHCSLK